MNIAAKMIGVVLAVGVLCGLGAGAAFAAAPAGHAPDAAAGLSSTSPSPQRSGQVGAPQFSTGFHIYNLTSTPMTLKSITGDGNFEGRPDVGSVLDPGQYADFEVTYKWYSDQRDDVVYSNGTSSIDSTLSLYPALAPPGQPESSCTVQAGPDTCSYTQDEGTTISLLEPAGTMVTYDSSQAQQQAAMLDQLCASGADATCDFLPTSETPAQTPQRRVDDPYTNASSLPVDYTLARSDTVNISDSVGVTATSNANALVMIESGILLKYGHTWPATHDFKVSTPLHIPPKTEVWYDDAPQLVHVTGTFAIAVGNTTINLTGVSFDFPNPNNTGNWTLMSQPIDGGPITATQLN